MKRLDQKKIIFPLFVIALTVGCASGPLPKDQALLNAEKVYQKAKKDPEVMEYAASQLQEANKSLQAAAQAETEEDMAAYAYIATAQTQSAILTAIAEKEEKRFVDLSHKKEMLMTQSLTYEKNRLENQYSELQAKETARGMMLTLGDVLFVSGKAELQPGAINPINQLAGFMKQHPEKTIVIEGHTDNTGNADSNTQLSLKRAEFVKSALIQRGIAADRIKAIGLGQSQPVTSNATEEGRKRNRRVEIIIRH